MKEHKLKPSLREKRRYLAYGLLSDNKLVAGSAKKELETKIKDFLGELDYSQAGIMVMDYGSNGIIRVNNKYLNKVRAAIMFITNIGENRVLIRTLKVSGMLNKAKELKIGGN